MAERPRLKAGGGVTMAPGSGRGKSVALLAAAVSLVCIALLVLFGRPPAPAPPPEARAPLASAAAEAPAPEAAPQGAPPGAPAVSAPAPAAEPPAREPAAGAGSAPREPEPDVEAGVVVPSGIGLFPPPGTDPVKVGLVVPDDFELPEGYLRHYQATDDGQDVPPILLFHPDYELLDDAGQPIPLPADRVVPPELAPPGMPIETVVLPEPREE
jgi:hypothetical protein